MAIELRDYQKAARSAIIREWDSGKMSTLAVLATGTGKTQIALGTLAQELQEGRVSRILAIAHRSELIYQPRDRVIEHWSDQLPIPGIVMAKEDECDSQFVVATVQSLSEKRLQRALMYGEFSHVWADECHHSVSNSWFSLIKTLRNATPRLRILGTTATPKRTDKRGLSQIFDSVAYRLSVKDAIKMGALCPFVAIAVELPVDIGSVKKTKDGWDDAEVGKILSLSNAEEVIVETWKKHASDKQTIAFTSSVEQAVSLMRAFERAGVRAATVNDKTPKEERKTILESYYHGDIQFVSNFGILTEGYDAPATSCIIMARPTKSDLVYLQAAGRGLRLAPGKQSCLILDFAPRNARNMRLAGDLLGKPQEQRKREERAAQSGLILSCFGINSQGEGIDADPDEIQMRVLDYLGSHHLAWTYDGGLATVSIAEKTSLVVVLPQHDRIKRADELRSSGKWSETWELEYRRITGYQVFAVSEKRATLLGIGATWEDASAIASDYADAHAEDWCSKKQSRWRNSPASDKQEKYCRALGVWRDGMTRGAAGQAITHAKVLSALRAAQVLR